MAAGPDETAVVRAARGGNQAAFEILVRRHTTALYRIALHLLGNAADAEDCVQESWVSAWRALPRFHGTAAITTWLYRITTNTALMHLRRRRAVVPLDRIAELPDTTPTGDPERMGASTAVRQALLRLPPDQRAAIVLREFAGLSYAELAGALDLSLPAARSRLHRARMRLTRLLEEWR